jgi:hypothetical protein
VSASGTVVRDDRTAIRVIGKFKPLGETLALQVANVSQAGTACGTVSVVGHTVTVPLGPYASLCDPVQPKHGRGRICHVFVLCHSGLSGRSQ